MKKFLILVRKEIKELVTIQMVLPLVIMVLMFSFIGNIMSKETAKISAPQPILLIDRDKTEISGKIQDVLNKVNFKVEILNYDDIDKAIGQAKEEKISCLLVIPSGFEKGIKEFKMQEIGIYKIIGGFSIISKSKYAAADRAVAIINDYLSNELIKGKNINVAPETLKNPLKSNEFVVINKAKANISLSLVEGFIARQTFFIPIILFFVIIISSQMVATTIASEKENKTFETLLSSPIKRKTIVFAKLMGAGIVAIISAGFYMIGFGYYMKGISGGQISLTTSGTLAESLKSLGVIMGPTDYFLLGLSLFSGILVALSLAMILGTLSEDVKNVQANMTPLMILVLLPYLMVLFLDINTMSPVIKYLIYIIPFAHPFLAAQNILTHDYLFIVLGILYQLVIFLILVIFISKIFSSDKILTLRLKFGRKK